MARFFDPGSSSGGGGTATTPAAQPSASELLYTPQDSLVRLSAVRAVAVEQGLDGLLFIAGVDSRDNLPCLQAINYLLLGASAGDLATPLLLDEELEDTILVVTAGGVRIYATPQAGEKVMRVASAWPGVELLALDRRAHRDQDLFEEHKMRSFRSMVADLRRIGVAVSPHVPDQPQAAGRGRHMAVEQWPLVQSYALDDDGGGGGGGGGGSRRFFTMAHDVVDVYPALEAVYRRVHAHDVAAAALRQRPLLAQHWQGVAAMLAATVARGGGGGCGSVAASAPENLATYFSYGAMRRGAELRSWGVRAPALLFGGQTALATPPPGGGGCSAAAAATPLHCTLEASDPQAPLSAARTLFLRGPRVAEAGESALAALGTASDYTRGLIPGAAVPAAVAVAEAADVARLAELYALLGRTVEAAAGLLCAARREDAAAAVRGAFEVQARASGVDLAAALGCAGGEAEVAGRLSVALHRLDNGPFFAEGSAMKSNNTSEHCVVYVRLHLAGVRSAAEGAPSLGGVLYGDTIAVAGGGEDGCCGTALNLTQAIPSLTTTADKSPHTPEHNLTKACDKVVDVWGGAAAATAATTASSAATATPRPSEAHAAALAEACPLRHFLCALTSREGGRLYVPMSGFGRHSEVEGRHLLFSEGLVACDAVAGCLQPLLLSRHASRVLVHNPMALDQPAVVVVHYTAEWGGLWAPHAAAQRAAHAADPEGSPDRCFVLVLQAGTAAKREFVRSVLPAWRTKGCVEVVAEPEPAVPYTEHACYRRYTEQQKRVSPSGLQVYSDVREYRPFGKTGGGGGGGGEEDEGRMAAWRGRSARAWAALRAAYPEWDRFEAASHLGSCVAPRTGGGVALPPGMLEEEEGEGEGGEEQAAAPATVLVDVVAGWLGVGKHRFSGRLEAAVAAVNAARRREGAAEERCHVVAGEEDEGVTFEPLVMYKRIREAVAVGVGRAGGGGGGGSVGGGRHRVVYTPPMATPVALVAHHLAQMCRKHKGMVLNSVTTLVHGDALYANNLSAPENFQVLPGLTDQLADGYVSQVLVSAGGGLSINAVESFVRAANTTCDVAYNMDDAVAGMVVCS